MALALARPLVIYNLSAVTLTLIIAMTYISSKLRERGINVLVVPEFATLIANGGGMININKMSRQQIIKLQVNDPL